MNDNYLKHHGVFGQRWGVQNGPPYPLDKSGKASIRRQAAEKRRELREKSEKEARVQKEASTYSKALSTKDLEEVVRHLRLEKELKSLLADEHPKEVKKGDAFVKDVVKQSGKQVLVKTLVAIGTGAVTTLLASQAIKMARANGAAVDESAGKMVNNVLRAFDSGASVIKK